MSKKHSKRIAEQKHLLQIGGPILVSQLAQVGMSVTDTVMAGRYSAADLAGVALGASIWIPVYVAFAGLLVANTTLVAHGVGAENPERTRKTAQQALWLALLLFPLPLLLLWQAELLLSMLGSSAEVSAIADHYLNALAPAVPAMACYLCLRGIAEGHSFTRPVMLISVAALALNIPLNDLFIHGRLGLSPLGGAGCAYATTILLWLQAVMLGLVVHRHGRFAQLQLFRYWSWPRLAPLRKLLALGVPIALTSFAETSLFSATTLLLAPLGATTIAANQIAINTSALLFMVPFSISVATTVRVGQHLGAGRPDRARFGAIQALKLCLLVPLLALVVLVYGGPTIATWYTLDTAVSSLAAHLLLLAAVYQFSDAIQACSLGALRGYRDTRVPFWLTLFAYWGVAVPVGYSLTYGHLTLEPWGVSGMWMGLIVGLTLAAVLLLLRLQWVSHRHSAGPA